MIVDVVALAGWTAEHAIRMAPILDQEVGLYWLEDPLAEQDIDGYRELRAGVETRICTGEKGWTCDHFGRLIDSAALDVIMIDPGKAEGVTGTWNVIQAAAAAGLSWNAHSWSSALNTAASLHLAAASSNVLVLELKPVPSPMQHELVRPRSRRPTAGSRADGPGLGVEVDEASSALRVQLTGRVSGSRSTASPPFDGHPKGMGAAGEEIPAAPLDEIGEGKVSGRQATRRSGPAGPGPPGPPTRTTAGFVRPTRV